MPIIIDKEGTREVTDKYFEIYMSVWNTEWNKDAHISIINNLHDELFNSILVQHNYTSFAELSIWAQEPNNEYYTEANKIKEWYKTTWVLIKEYSEIVTESTALAPEEFINNLPILNKPI